MYNNPRNPETRESVWDKKPFGSEDSRWKSMRELLRAEPYNVTYLRIPFDDARK